MPLSHETVVYNVHDCKVYALTADSAASPTYSPAVDVPGIASVEISPNFITAELKGDAKVIAKKGKVDKIAFSATYGKLSLDVLNVILQGTITDTGITQSNFRIKGANSLPYFKLAFKIDEADIGIGDVVCTLFKCQLTGGTLLGGSTDSFGQPTLQCEAIPTAGTADMLVDIDLYSTLQTLPA